MTRGSFLPGGGQGWAGAQDGPRTPLLRLWALRVPHCYGNRGRLTAPAGFKDERTKSSSWLPRWLSGQRLSAMQGAQVGPLGQEYPLEEEVPTHSSTLAWRIPGTEEPGSL